MANRIEPSELLESALSSLSLSDSVQRTVYKRAICLIAWRVRREFKLSDSKPKRADLRETMQSAQQSAEALLQNLENADLTKAIGIVGYREDKVEQSKRDLQELSAALAQSARALRLDERGPSRPWDMIEAPPKQLLILLCGKLFAHVKGMDRQPHEQTEFLDFIAPVWELATGMSGQDFTRQVDNTKEWRPANLIARLEGGDLVKRLDKALLRRRRTQSVRTRHITVRSSPSVVD